jgi:two-component system, NarL family, sensor kinase
MGVRTEQPPHEQSVRRAVLSFAISGLVAVLLLGFFAVQIIRDTAEEEAIDDATRITKLAAAGIVEPRLTEKLLEGDEQALENMDHAVQRLLGETSIVRVKVWSLDGTIIYSDQEELIGQRYRLEEDQRVAMRDQSTASEISDVSGPENRFEARYGELLEVYQGLQTTDGQPVLFEAYQTLGTVAANTERIYVRFLPALFGALLLLELIQIPLAIMLARRLRDRQRERSALLQRAVDASAEERRRIAASLHDGPVQELAGVGFSLAAAAGRMEGDDRVAVEDAAARTRSTMRDLRTMLVELYPASLHRSGLAAAVSDVLSPLRASGVETTVDIPADVRMPEPVEALLFRTAREAVQNTRKHARASHVAVRLEQENGRVALSVQDDGRGFTPQANGRRANGEGGLGLRLVSDLAAEAGGRLDIHSAPEHGTLVRVEVPVS